MEALVIALAVGFLLAIRPALRHDSSIRKVYSVDKRPVPVRIRAFLHRAKR